MQNHQFNTIAIADGTEMELYVAFPESEGSHPAIIVFQEAFGVNAHIRNVAERFCKEGYAVVSPDLYHRTVRRLEASYEEFPSIIQHYQAITIEDLTADIQATYAFLQQQPQVSADKTGCVGYCLGGRVSFIANAVLPLSAGISYYGGGIDLVTEKAADLHAPHLFFWGGLDKHITQETTDKVINAVKQAGKEYTNVTISYADHGFNCDDRSAYHPLAAKEAWAHTLGFFANRLK